MCWGESGSTYAAISAATAASAMMAAFVVVGFRRQRSMKDEVGWCTITSSKLGRGAICCEIG